MAGLSTSFSALSSSWPLSLGGVVFDPLEEPTDGLPLPSEEQLAVFTLPGGGKVVHDLGTQPGSITWKGELHHNCVDRAKSIYLMKNQGQPVKLAWGEFKYDVIVKSFSPTFHGRWLADYTIELEVVSDNTGLQPNPVSPSVDQQTSVLADQALTRANNANALDSSLSDVPPALVSIRASLAALGPIATAPASAIAPIVSAVQAQMNRANAYTAPLLSATPTATNSTLLTEMTLVGFNLQLMATNLQGTQTATSITVNGGTNLFRLAAKYYGDPSLWTVIAAANKLYTSELPRKSISLLIPPAQPSGLIQ